MAAVSWCLTCPIIHAAARTAGVRGRGWRRTLVLMKRKRHTLHRKLHRAWVPSPSHLAFGPTARDQRLLLDAFLLNLQKEPARPGKGREVRVDRSARDWFL